MAVDCSAVFCSGTCSLSCLAGCLVTGGLGSAGGIAIGYGCAAILAVVDPNL
jgi:hypothetical protein